MGTLIVNFRGVNAYVPHVDSSLLLAVMPNSSRLGNSPSEALDGTPLARHLPFLWEKQVDINGNFSVVLPRPFPGARLTFDLEGTPSALDLSAIDQNAAQGWLEVDPDLLAAQADDRLSGQVLLRHGTVEVYEPPVSLGGPCNPIWSDDGFSEPLATVVVGLTVSIDGVDRVTATATTWVDAGSHTLYSESLEEKDVELFVGNFCAEDALDWPRNSMANRRVVDDDFKWIYGLSTNAAIHARILAGEPLPAPEVAGSPIRETMVPSDAFDTFWGGGGGAGCECNGCIDKPKGFS